MRGTFGSLLAATLLAGCGAAPTTLPAPPARTPLAARVAAVVDSIERSSHPRAHVGVALYDAIDGRWLYARHAERLFRPASAAKLLTAAAALAELEPGWRWETPVLSGCDGGALLVGSGDPSWSARFHASGRAVADSLADSLRLVGVAPGARVTLVTGALTGPALPWSWEIGDTDWYYAAPTAAVAFDEAAYGITVRPGPLGAAAAAVLAAPPGFVELSGAITTTPGAEPWTETLERQPAAAGAEAVERLWIGGTIGAGAPVEEESLAMTSPVRWAAELLERARAEPGVAGPVVDVEQPACPLAAARTLFVWRSPPLSEVLAAALPSSQNWIMDQLFRTVGARLGAGAGWDEAADAVEAVLAERIGIEPDALVLADGSGLSARNLITPAAMVRLLDAALASSWGHALRSALASPGQPGSTLEDRLTDLRQPVLAKSGSATNAHALAGYLTAEDGRVLVFAVFVNNSGGSWSRDRAAIDRIVRSMTGAGD